MWPGLARAFRGNVSSRARRFLGSVSVRTRCFLGSMSVTRGVFAGAPDREVVMKLHHFSEEPDIAVFRPHIAKTSSIQDEALVWAIDGWHAPMYYLPRDCPRACFWAG